MPSRSGDLLIHPVRLRVIRALLRRPMAAAELQEVLGDVAQATLYRHLAALEEGGIIEVVERRQARGGTERTFAVVDGAASLRPEDLGDATPEDHLRWFTTFVGTLLTDFAAYLDTDEVDVVADRVGYRQVPLWLTDDEAEAFAAELRAVVEHHMAFEPVGERRRRILSTVFVPDDRARAADEDGPADR